MKYLKSFTHGAVKAVLADLIARLALIGWHEIFLFLGHVSAVLALHSRR